MCIFEVEIEEMATRGIDPSLDPSRFCLPFALKLKRATIVIRFDGSICGQRSGSNSRNGRANCQYIVDESGNVKLNDYSAGKITK